MRVFLASARELPMRKSIALVLAVVTAAWTLTVQPAPAEARRWGGAVAGAIIGGVVVGAIIASQHRKRHRYYAYRGGPRYYAYRPAYYRYW